MEEGENKKSDTINISIKKDEIWKYSTFILAGILIIGAFIFFTGDNYGNPSPTGAVVDEGDELPTIADVDIENDAILGDPDAPVTIIEFSDYQCPFCARFWSETLPSIKSEYIDTGKVRFVYRDFPLTSMHPMALAAAEVTECVKKQGGDEAFWEIHYKIFENYQQISTANLKAWATELGYNIDSCLDSGEMEQEIQDDLKDGVAAGVRGTPAFFVNGKLLSGAQPFSVFQQVIESEL